MVQADSLDGVVHARHGLIVRAEPSTDADKLDTFRNRSRISVICSTDTDGKTWLKVQMPSGNTGWVVSEYVAFPEGEDSVSQSCAKGVHG
jgi:hypothetical protein